MEQLRILFNLYLLSMSLTGTMYLISQAIFTFSLHGKYENQVRYSYIQKYIYLHRKQLRVERFFLCFYYFVPVINLITAFSAIIANLDAVSLRAYSNDLIDYLMPHIKQEYADYLTIGRKQDFKSGDLGLFAMRKAIQEIETIKTSEKKNKKFKKGLRKKK